MQVYRLHEKIYHAKFEDQYGMCMTILRIHEHEENPVFKNKIFTFEQYMDWYVKNMGEGHFNFDKKILGFSIPGTCFRRFIKHFPTDKQTDKEKAFIEMMIGIAGKEIFENKDIFSVVATFNRAKSPDFKHEIAHSFYYIDEEYRTQVKKLIRKIDKDVKQKLSEYIIGLGYLKSEVPDELNARLSVEKTIADGGKTLATRKVMLPFKELLKLTVSKYLDGDKNEEQPK